MSSCLLKLDLRSVLSLAQIEELRLRLRMKKLFGSVSDSSSSDEDETHDSSTIGNNSATTNCLLCGRPCATERSLHNHLQYAHSGREYVCSLCNQSFKARTNLQNHEKTFHADGEPWTFECPECGIRKRTEQSLSGHRLRDHGVNTSEQRETPAMRLTSSHILAAQKPANDERAHGGIIFPYVEHKRCPHCGECQAKEHTWARHVELSCVLNSRQLPALGKAFTRDDLHGMESCHCIEEPGSQVRLPCNHLLQDLLGDEGSDLRTHPDVAEFYRTFGATEKKTKFVYLLFRARPNIRLSKEELARSVFYVGQTRDPKKRMKYYYKTLLVPLEKMNKRQERFRYENDTAMRNRESVIMLRVRVVVGDKTLRLFYPDVLESSLMLLLGMDRLSNIELSLRNSACKLSDKNKAALRHARLAAYAAFEATSRVVDVADWNPTAWMDVTEEMRKHKELDLKASYSHALVAFSTNPSAEADQSLYSPSTSRPTTSFADSSVVSSSASQQASNASTLLAAQCIQLRGNLKIEFRKRDAGHVVAQGSPSSDCPAPAAKRRCSDDSKLQTNAGKKAPCQKTTLLTPTPNETSARDFSRSFHALANEFGYTFEEGISYLNALNRSVSVNSSSPTNARFVSSDGVTPSGGPAFSSAVATETSDPAESIKLCPLPQGSFDTFAQSQRKHG